MLTALPFLTAELPGTGGVIKTRPEDFRVEEVPSYEPSGEGDHAYAFIEKRNIGTREALNRVAQALNISQREIGAAGLKDAQAITRQWISIEHADPEQLARIEPASMRVLRTTRHTNKLKPGHLKGNRFVIRLREMLMPLDEAARIAEAALEVLTRRGVPNYFGPQRFGNRIDNHLLGKAVIRNDAEAFMDLFLGDPRQEYDMPRILQARTLYEQGQYEEALDAIPGQYSDRRRAMRAMARTGGKKKRAFFGVDKRLKGLFISAYQSTLFNAVLAIRMPRIDVLLEGDMACKHVNGASFPVEQPEVEQPRCDAFEISPTGPLYGQRMARLTGPAGEIENPILDAEGLTDDEIRQMKRLGARGGRRPLRFQPKDTGLATGTDDLGPYLELRFELPAGCYATTLLSEITKDRGAEEKDDLQ